MKLVVDGYEIEITAKMKDYGYDEERDTKAFLNGLCCMLEEAEESFKQNGYPSLALEAHRHWKDIYDALDSTGYYNEA